MFREVDMFSEIWKMLKETVLAFVDDEALSRGAAIAFYTVTSIAPVLLIVIAIAGLAFGRDAAQLRSQVPPANHLESSPRLLGSSPYW
jgi:uncharacterized BrkB/YihY/UPF0761 family membrane protein